MIPKPQTLIISLLANLVLLGSTLYFYTAQSEKELLLAKQKKELQEAIGKEAELNQKINALQGRLTLISESESDSGSDTVQRLNKALDEKDATINQLKQQLEQAQNNPRRGGNRGTRQSPQEAMQRLKTENPEAYEKMMAAREKWQKAQEAQAEKRDQYLSGLDSSKLTSDQQRAIADYQNLLGTQQQLRENMMNNSGGRETFMAMMQNQRALQQLSTQVQDILIEQYANSLSNGNGAAVAEEIRDIIEATSVQNGRGPMGPPPPM